MNGSFDADQLQHKNINNIIGAHAMKLIFELPVVRIIFYQDQSTKVSHSCGRILRPYSALVVGSLNAMHTLREQQILHHTDANQVKVGKLGISKRRAMTDLC